MHDLPPKVTDREAISDDEFWSTLVGHLGRLHDVGIKIDSNDVQKLQETMDKELAKDLLLRSVTNSNRQQSEVCKAAVHFLVQCGYLDIGAERNDTPLEDY